MKTTIRKFCERSGGFRFLYTPKTQSALLALLLWLPVSAAETWTIPSGAETRENPYNKAEPFSRPGDIVSQQIYSSSLFPMISTPGQLFQLDGFAFRLSTQGTISFPSEATFERVEVLLSTGNGPFSTSLEQNHGDDVLAVYDQPLTLRGNVPPGATPSSFDLQITFTTPFLYNPSEGALVLEIRKYGFSTLPVLGGSEINGTIFYSDRGLGVDTSGNIGLETLFTYQVVPEPGPAALISFGGLILAALRWKGKQ